MDYNDRCDFNTYGYRVLEWNVSSLTIKRYSYAFVIIIHLKKRVSKTIYLILFEQKSS